MTATTGNGTRAEAARRYPPLLVAMAAMAALLMVLPSTLNVPQTNPSTTLEFAPVPPSDDDPPPDAGNASSLALGTSGAGPSAGGEPGGGGPGPGPTDPPEAGVLPDQGVPTGTGNQPSDKRCVGNPPRQTEDPLSPPCVAYFNGDNGGSTHRGVSGDTINVVFPIDPGGPPDNSEGGLCFDLDDENDDPNSLYRPGLKALLNFFNTRYQTYGRRVHGWVCNSEPNRTAESRRLDANNAVSDYDPFAVVTSGMLSGGEQAYIETVADKEVLSFGSSKGPAPQSQFTRTPGFVWSFTPTVEVVAARFSDFVCKRVVPFPVVDGPNAGKKRVLGLLRTTDEGYPNLIQMSKLIRQQVEACGGDFVLERTFPQADAYYQTQGPDPAATYARRNTADFAAAGVTTVIWAGGYESEQSKAAQDAGYLPEWIVAGDGLLDAISPSHQQGQRAWPHATVVSYNLRTDTVPSPERRQYDDPHFYCGRAILEGNPQADAQDITTLCAMSFYEDMRQLFQGIQLAGPQLTPANVDEGFHAIPPVASTNPHVPACFYPIGDFTCTKDVLVEHWDEGTGGEGYSNDGCYRMVDAGRRWQEFRRENIDARRKPSDPCNYFNRLAYAF